jgi:hypothetical protein
MEIPAVNDEISALLRNTMLLVSNWQADRDSSPSRGILRYGLRIVILRGEPKFSRL